MAINYIHCTNTDQVWHHVHSDVTKTLIISSSCHLGYIRQKMNILLPELTWWGKNMHASLLWWLESDPRWLGQRIWSAMLKACQTWPKKEENEPVTGSLEFRPGGLRGPSQQMSYVILNHWRSSCYFWYTGVRIYGLLQFVVFFKWKTHFIKIYYGTKATWQNDDLEQVLLGNLGSCHIDVTLTQGTNLIADHYHSFMHRTFPDVFSFSRVTHHATTQNR